MNVKIETIGHECLQFTKTLPAGAKKISKGYSVFCLTSLLPFKNSEQSPLRKNPTRMEVSGSKGGTINTKKDG